MLSGRCAPAIRCNAAGSAQQTQCGTPTNNLLRKAVFHALYTLIKLQGLWPHRAVVAGQAVSSGFLEGTWNARRVLFSGFA
jgi:hypothetical protein